MGKTRDLAEGIGLLGFSGVMGVIDFAQLGLDPITDVITIAAFGGGMKKLHDAGVL